MTPLFVRYFHVPSSNTMHTKAPSHEEWSSKRDICRMRGGPGCEMARRPHSRCEVGRRPGEVPAATRTQHQTCENLLLLILFLWVSIFLRGSSSVDFLQAIAWQISRLLGPREPAKDRGRDPHFHRGKHAGPLRAPRPREGEKIPRQEKQKRRCEKTV